MSDEHPRDSNVTTPCRECGLEILAQARVCGHCESYQAHWRNELRYFANIAGVFTVMGTATFFAVTLAPTMRRSLYWTDRIEVVQLDDNALTLGNAGDGNVFIYEVVLEGPNGSAMRQIQDTLPPGAVWRLDGDSIGWWWGDVPHHLRNDHDFGLQDSEVADARLLWSTDPLWERARTEAVWDIFRAPPEDPAWDILCFGLVPVSRGGIYWNRVLRLSGREPSSIPIEGTVRGFSLARGKTFETRFTVEGLVVHNVRRIEEGATHEITGEPLPAGALECEVS